MGSLKFRKGGKSVAEVMAEKAAKAVKKVSNGVRTYTSVPNTLLLRSKSVSILDADIVKQIGNGYVHLTQDDVTKKINLLIIPKEVMVAQLKAKGKAESVTIEMKRFDKEVVNADGTKTVVKKVVTKDNSLSGIGTAVKGRKFGVSSETEALAEIFGFNVDALKKGVKVNVVETLVKKEYKTGEKVVTTSKTGKLINRYPVAPVTLVAYEITGVNDAPVIDEEIEEDEDDNTDEVENNDDVVTMEDDFSTEDDDDSAEL